jgi:hypothetical protein
MRNKLEDLRNHLFAQIERLQDDDCKLDEEIKRANALVPLAQTLIDTAKVENDFLRILNGHPMDNTGFIEVTPQNKLNGGTQVFTQA